MFTDVAPEQLAFLRIADGGKCSIDTINKNASETGWMVHGGDVVTVGGWVLDMESKTTSEWAVLRLDPSDGSGPFYFATRWREGRPDLTQAFGAGPGVSTAMFILTASTDSLPDGSYALTVLHESKAGGQICRVPKILNVMR